MSASSTANWRGGSTTAGTPTVRTGSTSSSGPTSSSAGRLPGESRAGTMDRGDSRLAKDRQEKGAKEKRLNCRSACPDGDDHPPVRRQRRIPTVLDRQDDVRCA